METAFITGCASGFGYALASRLLALGYRVFATDKDVEGLAAKLGNFPDLHVFALDVRQDEAVQQTVSRALAIAPVDVLVNNAGYALFGTVEEVDLEAVREVFEVNFLGVVRVTQALLPCLRERAGTVVQLSSVAGRTVFPESGFYAATKYSVEALSEALFQETCSFGVKVRLIEPGSFATKFLEHAVSFCPPDSPYSEIRQLWDKRKVEVLESPQNPELVVDAIVGSLNDESPFLRLPVGLDSERILALFEALGADAWSRFSADRNGLDHPAHLSSEVMFPHEVIHLMEDDESNPILTYRRLYPTFCALAHGHLDHWTLSEEGRLALSLLAGV
ncbi:MAG: SDR family oxidoreductase [Proteobacteria bacterium]|nr:SDR family oxidoreductase [Pseudomonadota bacterium]